ncbi:MAG: flavin reductase family protein [Candidatus Lokiarchaeota archaeon]|nr:flavin reductase family protein [Candidatus Lokiarchaeota archaeon]
MKKIDSNAFVYPMPMVLVGTHYQDRPNFMPVGWINRVNFNPPLIAAGINSRHTTAEAITETEVFSVNIPDESMVEVTDYCGLVKGKNVDKSELFDIFYGDLSAAPMIKQCKLTLECKLFQKVEFPTNTLFVGEIANVYADTSILTDEKPDIKKLKPFTLTMPDNRYWTVGERLGDAWKIGNSLKD